MNKLSALILIVSITTLAFKSDKPAYRLFDSNGKEVGYNEMMKDISEADVVFIGEIHNDPVAHWMEYEITGDLSEIRKGDLVMGAEMFERDNQLLIDEYLGGLYESDKFEAEVKLWNNYKTDYKPLLDLAREKGIRFIATNIPRRYASMVSRKGLEVLDSLSDEAKEYIAPLPILYDPTVKCYSDMLSMEGMPGHMSDNIPKAQAVKDATMSYSILQNYDEGNIFVHYNGSYHSSNFEGIVWYLKQSRDDLVIKTIEIVEQDDIDKLESDNLGVANYVIAVPASMTKTY